MLRRFKFSVAPVLTETTVVPSKPLLPPGPLPSRFAVKTPWLTVVVPPMPLVPFRVSVPAPVLMTLPLP